VHRRLDVVEMIATALKLGVEKAALSERAQHHLSAPQQTSY